MRRNIPQNRDFLHLMIFDLDPFSANSFQRRARNSAEIIHPISVASFGSVQVHISAAQMQHAVNFVSLTWLSQKTF
jgi:hypothetical protein